MEHPIPCVSGVPKENEDAANTICITNVKTTEQKFNSETAQKEQDVENKINISYQHEIPNNISTETKLENDAQVYLSVIGNRGDVCDEKNKLTFSGSCVNTRRTDDNVFKDELSDSEIRKIDKPDTASADSEDSALGSLPPEQLLNDKEEVQVCSDGSDSGLGADVLNEIKVPAFNLIKQKHEESTKIKLFESEETPLTSKDNSSEPKCESHQLIRLTSRLKRKNDITSEGPQSKKEKKMVKFDSVTVYYFPRSQGFTCVPSQGGSTLGMDKNHVHSEKFTIHEHAIEQRRLHKQIIHQLRNEKHNLQGTLSSSEDSDTEEEPSDVSESELDLDNYYFLQPISTRQRRALLRAAGVRKIEGFEKDECRDIRMSRELCGCACKVYCNPQTCSCSLAGIKCQVDRPNFPCGCTRDRCHNTTGRTEFNPIRVRTHFIHTLMRLGLEKKNEENMQLQRAATNPFQAPISNVLPTFTEMSSRNISSNVKPEEISSTIVTSTYNQFQNESHSTSDVLRYRENTTTPGCVDVSRLHMSDAGIINLNNQYTSGILDKPYSGSLNYENSVSRLYNLNHSYVPTENQFKPLQYSASHFEEFAHSSHMSMFNYGHLYMQDYISKTNNQAVSYSHSYNIYDKSNGLDKGSEPQYTTLESNSSYEHKIETNTSGNWFNSSEIQTIDPNEVIHTNEITHDNTSENIRPEENEQDASENFGELIKKTMVESVSV